MGLDMDPTTASHDWFWAIPNDLNKRHQIGFRVRYSTDGTTDTDDRHWVVLYDVISEDSAMAVGTTALDTAIAAELDNGTANAWQESPRGILDGNTLTAAQVAAMDFMTINLVLLLDDNSGGALNMYGLVLDYMPKRDESVEQGRNSLPDQY